jgi:NADH:ubiquinone oxidoreductase subunit D
MQEEIVKNIILGEDEDYIINMGPQHPSTHGVLRFEVSLQGERIKKVVPHCGYIHRGIEKMCERDTYPQIIHRQDGLSFSPYQQ